MVFAFDHNCELRTRIRGSLVTRWLPVGPFLLVVSASHQFKNYSFRLSHTLAWQPSTNQVAAATKEPSGSGYEIARLVKRCMSLNKITPTCIHC